MFPLGNPLSGPAIAPAPPPAPPPTAGSAPVAATDAGAGAGSAAYRHAGNPPPGGAPDAAGAGGTPVTAPATRRAFSDPGDVASAEEREPAARRTWRMADVVAAISGGPRARRLIEAASRPGPVEPGSLLEAVKALRPAPALPQSTRIV